MIIVGVIYKMFNEYEYTSVGAASSDTRYVLYSNHIASIDDRRITGSV